MPLRHLTIPSWPRIHPPKFPSYAFANHVQGKLQQDLLAWKAINPDARPPAPPPTLISFTPTPTYTLGRRQTEPLSTTELARLQAPLQAQYPDAPEEKSASEFTPAVTHAPRGGLTTYHGPGQVVFWPVIDLHSPLHAHFTVRDYACLLEKTTIAALARYGITGFTTENPGVWIHHGHDHDTKREERKIAALGVHLRRHVTGLGVAVNWGMPVVGPEAVNPWARIVACGLGDKLVTSVADQLGGRKPPVPYEDLAAVWASEFAARLKLHDGGGADIAVGADEARFDWEKWEREAGWNGDAC